MFSGYTPSIYSEVGRQKVDKEYPGNVRIAISGAFLILLANLV